MKSMEELVDFYFRPNRLPHLWCPGCGNGVVLGALLKAIDAENLEESQDSSFYIAFYGIMIALV